MLSGAISSLRFFFLPFHLHEPVSDGLVLLMHFRDTGKQRLDLFAQPGRAGHFLTLRDAFDLPPRGRAEPDAVRFKYV